MMELLKRWWASRIKKKEPRREGITISPEVDAHYRRLAARAPRIVRVESPVRHSHPEPSSPPPSDDRLVEGIIIGSILNESSHSHPVPQESYQGNDGGFSGGGSDSGFSGSDSGSSVGSDVGGSVGGDVGGGGGDF